MTNRPNPARKKAGLCAIIWGAIVLLNGCGESADTPVSQGQSSKQVVLEPEPSVQPTIQIVEAVDGQKLYKRCAVCHLPTGEGLPGAYPPLKGRLAPLISSEAGREYFILTTLYGVSGKIEIDGVSYSGLMPAQPGMNDERTAAVLNYIAGEFIEFDPESADRFTADEVAKVRAENGRISGSKVFEKRPAAFGVK